MPNYFIQYYKAHFIIDFISSFTYIIDKRKIVCHYLKKVGIFVSSIYYYTKTNSSKKSFILTTIAIIFSYYIRLRIRDIIIITFIWVIIETTFVGGIIFTLDILRINISFALLLAISKMAIFSTFYHWRNSDRHIFITINSIDFFDVKCFSY